jgi:hypothetical protein
MVSPPTLPINSLLGFLDEIEKLFDNMTESWSHLLFREKDRDPILQAWNDLKPTLVNIKGTISHSTGDIVGKLKDAGLAAGKQLDLKLRMLNDAWNRFKKRGTVRFLKELLGWINKLLGSLAKAIPGGEALKEFKEVIEKAIA